MYNVHTYVSGDVCMYLYTSIRLYAKREKFPEEYLFMMSKIYMGWDVGWAGGGGEGRRRIRDKEIGEGGGGGKGEGAGEEGNRGRSKIVVISCDALMGGNLSW